MRRAVSLVRQFVSQTVAKDRDYSVTACVWLLYPNESIRCQRWEENALVAHSQADGATKEDAL